MLMGMVSFLVLDEQSRRISGARAVGSGCVSLWEDSDGRGRLAGLSYRSECIDPKGLMHTGGYRGW